MAYEVPLSPYGYHALKPAIDEVTRKLHHDKHHHGYVDKASASLQGTACDGQPVEQVLVSLDRLAAGRQEPFRNDGGGHAKRRLFWDSMITNGGAEPFGAIADAIRETSGSFEDLTSRFEADGVARFGSGWTWLVLVRGSRKLTRTPHQDNPSLRGQAPLRGRDAWERAYHLTYTNPERYGSPTKPNLAPVR